MRVQSPTVTDPGFIALCIQLAQATFAKDMPGKSDPKASATRSSAENGGRNWISAINDWFYRQQVKDREAYLAQSADIFELERRIRDLERRPYY